MLWMGEEFGDCTDINANEKNLAQASNAHLSAPSFVKIARLERSGQISVMPAAREPHVIDVKVEKGVQTVQIKLDYSAQGEKY
ncbi:hypothetical protein NUACC26_046320 [Scytonema sp. NUACC26]